MEISDEKKVERQNTSLIDHSQLTLQQFNLVYGKKLQSPILGYCYEIPDLLTSYIPSVTLDTSLSHIPVYTHLKIYDLKPVQLSKRPPILSALQLQSSVDTIFDESSREISSNERLSDENKALSSYNVRNSPKVIHKE